MGDLYALVFAVELKARGVREFDEELLDVGDDEARLEEVLEGWMPLSRAATLSGLSASTLRNQVRSGRLKARKVGRNWLTKPSWSSSTWAAEGTTPRRRLVPSA